MSDRVALMMGGEVLQVAPPAEIYDRPAELRVAEFIGSPKINVLPGTVRSDGGIDRARRRAADRQRPAGCDRRFGRRAPRALRCR